MSNKSKDLNPKNGIYNAYKQKVSTILSRQANDTYKDKYFADEYQAVYFGANLLKWVSNTVSAITFVIAAYLAFKTLFGVYLSSILAVASAILFEFIKNKIWKISSKQILKYKRVSIVAVSALVGLHLVSFLGSCFGAYKIPTLVKHTAAAPALIIDIDSINKSYLVQIAKIDNIIIEQSKNASNTTSNYTKGKINNTLLSLTNQKDKLLEAQKIAIQTAKAQNNTELSERKEDTRKAAIQHQESIYQIQISCIGAAIFFEIVFILCSIFIAYYLFRKFIDDTEKEANEQTSTGQKQTSNISEIELKTGHEAPSIENAKKVVIKGFVSDKSKRQDGKRSQQLEYTRICELEQCSKPYIHSIHNQKYCTNECRKEAYNQRKRFQ